MRRSIAHITLSLTMLLNGMSYSLIQMDFVLNREAIAALFCINQDKPELACDGKCELNRRLDEAQSHEENTKSIVQKEVVVYTIPGTEVQVSEPSTPAIPAYKVFDDRKFIFLNTFGFFHPPKS